MLSLTTLNIISGFITLSGMAPYIVSILRKRTKPNIVTWWIWSGVGFLIAATYYDIGSRAALGLSIGSFIGNCFIALLALKYGVGGSSKTDRVCLLGATVTAVLWWLLPSAFIPHLLAILIDFFGWLPTLRKTLEDPSTENSTAWMLWTFAALFSFIALSGRNGIDAIYPMFIVITDGIILFLVLRYKLQKHPTRYHSKIEL